MVLYVLGNNDSTAAGCGDRALGVLEAQRFGAGAASGCLGFGGWWLLGVPVSHGQRSQCGVEIAPSVISVGEG